MESDKNVEADNYQANNFENDPIEKDKAQDSSLMALIATGDKIAMSTFVNRYLNSIVNFALRYVGQRCDAEDVAQEAFTRVWTKAAQWKQTEIPARNWLYRITYNLCIDIIRKRKRANESASQDDLVTCVTPETQLGSSEKLSILAQALNTLPERQSTAIELCHYQGLSNREAANAMNITTEALESLLSRGRRKLRELLLTERGTQ